MRCTTYCTASNYDMPMLFQALQKRATPQLFRDVIHLQLREDRKIKGDLFYFSYGSLVIWGLTEEEERHFLEEVGAFEREPFPKPEIDEFTFSFGDAMRIEEDEIILHNKAILTKLAISHGLAQSVKLSVFEARIARTIEETQHLPERLATVGKISLSRGEISRKMGELFIERNFINTRTEILDVPEFFWDYPELEPFYRRTSHYLDVTKRVEVLNKRLNVVHELFEILSNELNHQHSSRLEWTIIVLIVIEVFLIVIEVALAVARDLYHLI